MDSEHIDCTTAYIAIGSNIEPERNIPAALELLRLKTSLTALSHFYETPAIDRPEQPNYLNGMARVECVHSASVLKYDVLRTIEAELGRQRTDDNFAPRTIDLDLVLFGNSIIRVENLILPDPDLRVRPFLLAALIELAPDLTLPDSGERIVSLLRDEDRRALRPVPAFSLRLKERLGL